MESCPTAKLRHRGRRRPRAPLRYVRWSLTLPKRLLYERARPVQTLLRCAVVWLRFLARLPWGRDLAVLHERRHWSRSRAFPGDDSQCPPFAERLENAERVSEVEATVNYSYGCDRLFGYHLLLAGEAFALFNPRFSSGVMPAMVSGVAGSICG